MCIALLKKKDASSTSTSTSTATPKDLDSHKNTKNSSLNSPCPGSSNHGNAHNSKSPSTSTNTKRSQESPSPSSSVKRRVRFQDTPPQIIDTIKPSSAMTQEEISQIFWQLKDFEYFRGTAKIIASEVLKLSASQPACSHNYDSVLSRAHHFCSSHLYDNNLEEKLDAQDFEAELLHEEGNETILPPNLFAALTHWIKAGHSRRGLEKFCVPHHMRVRPLERRAVIQGVLIAQDLLAERRREVKLMNLNTNMNKNTKRTDDPDNGKFILGSWEIPLDLPDEEILRIVSMRIGSKASRKFAIAMGHADAAAAGNYDYNFGKI